MLAAFFRQAGVKDGVLLLSGAVIFWYGGRFLFYGVRWGVNSTFFLAEPLVRSITPEKRWVQCPAAEPRACEIQYCYTDKGRQQNVTQHFATIVHYYETFVHIYPALIMVHLICIVTAGVLWPLQLWGRFRTSNYRRHAVLGYATFASLLGALSTAAVFSLHHVRGSSLGEKATGIGYLAIIGTAVYNIVVGFSAARKRDINRHNRCVLRVIGLCYGVFPFKQMFAAFPLLNLLPGFWPYTAAVALSAATGVLVTERVFGGLLPEDRQHAVKQE